MINVLRPAVTRMYYGKHICLNIYKVSIKGTGRVLYSANISILIVNPLDDITNTNANIGYVGRYRHGGVCVNVVLFSIVFVFRMVNTWAQYDGSNRMIHPNLSFGLSTKSCIVGSDIHEFHKELLKLYKAKFK